MPRARAKADDPWKGRPRFCQKVTCAQSRSDLHASLEALANQENGKRKVWIAHFDDSADVRWDRTLSPVGNWRTQLIEPHRVRQASQRLLGLETF